MEQDFFNKLRESMDAERDFQPDPADWETLQQRLTTIPVSSVPFYFTTKFRLAMLTTVFIAIGSFFYWSVPTAAPEIITNITPKSAITTTNKLNKKINADAKNTLIIDENTLTQRATTEHLKPAQNRKTVTTQRKSATNVKTTSVIVPPQKNTIYRTQISSYENADITIAESAVMQMETDIIHQKINEDDSDDITDYQSNKQENVELELLANTAFYKLEMQGVEEDTFIVRQQILDNKDRAFRWQLAIYSTWSDDLLNSFFEPFYFGHTIRNNIPYNSDGLGVGMKASVLYKNRLRFTFHGNSHYSRYDLKVTQVFGNVTEEEYFSSNGNEISQTVVVNESFNVNDYEYGASFEYFPITSKKLKPYLGVGAYHLKLSRYNRDIEKDSNQFVRSIEQGYKTIGRTTLTPIVGLEYAFRNDFHILLQGMSYFTVRDELKYNSMRIEVGFGYTF